VPPFDAPAAEDALAALLGSERARAAFGRAGRAFAARYAWPNVAASFVAVYRSARARRTQHNTH
jgi:glycosyltransferase involved in cell wall biosynthesis